jgi:hypothetical protein
MADGMGLGKTVCFNGLMFLIPADRYSFNVLH